MIYLVVNAKIINIVIFIITTIIHIITIITPPKGLTSRTCALAAKKVETPALAMEGDLSSALRRFSLFQLLKVVYHLIF